MLADIDLAFNPHEKRDAHGEWTRGGKVLKAADASLLSPAYEGQMKPKRAGAVNKKLPGEPSYADVAEAYGWQERDAGGSDGKPATTQAIHQQGLAQIHAKTWESDVGMDAPDDEQYAASLWQQYQSPSLYSQINETLRENRQVSVKGAKGPKPDDMRRYVGVMFDKGGYTTTAPMTVYRALKTDPGPIDWKKKLTPGSTFTDAGLVSTTAQPNFAQGWLRLDHDGGSGRPEDEDDVVMEVHLPKGTRIVGGDPQFVETMLKPDSKFKIISSETRTATKSLSPIDGESRGINKPFTYTHVIAEVQP
jgi:hypothetical protein